MATLEPRADAIDRLIGTLGIDAEGDLFRKLLPRVEVVAAAVAPQAKHVVHVDLETTAGPGVNEDSDDGLRQEIRAPFLRPAEALDCAARYRSVAHRPGCRDTMTRTHMDVCAEIPFRSIIRAVPVAY